jgi:aspartate racemase
MQTMVGLVGGLGPEATIDYYRRILAAWEQQFPGFAPAMIIDSLDATRALRLAASDRAELAEYVLGSVRRLEAAGAHFAVITSNTTHVVFDDVAARCSIPLISIVETCADDAVRLGLKRCLLIGTRLTMEAPLYPKAFARRGLEIVVPDERDRVWIHQRYVSQLLKGDFRDETRREFVSLVRRLHEKQAPDAVILGGTELPLLLRTSTVADLPTLDTTGLHVAAIVQRLATT